MTKLGVVPDELTRPFWEAASRSQLVIQKCGPCDRFQHPPEASCSLCGTDGGLFWEEVSGRGVIYNYGVVHDCPVRLLQDDQPFNVAVVMLEEDPGIQMYSHLPGTASDEVPVGAKVRVIFEETANGQLVPEWKIAS